MIISLAALYTERPPTKMIEITLGARGAADDHAPRSTHHCQVV
jgi:hypothetical protein